jgi:hypothetical protein
LLAFEVRKGEGISKISWMSEGQKAGEHIFEALAPSLTLYHVLYRSLLWPTQDASVKESVMLPFGLAFS